MKTTLDTGIKRTFFRIVGVAFLTACVSIAGTLGGCSLSGSQVLPDSLENRLTHNGTADDHLTAATLYQHQAQLYGHDTRKYEQQAAAIRPLEDPKGFRRTGLMRTADSLRKKAGDMNELYAAHELKAETMTGMHPRR
jgi:hypothetical protein